jgi:hypothetical protein
LKKGLSSSSQKESRKICWGGKELVVLPSAFEKGRRSLKKGANKSGKIMPEYLVEK